jgi:hypothetical protein
MVIETGPIRTFAPANYPETSALSRAVQQYGNTLLAAGASARLPPPRPRLRVAVTLHSVVRVELAYDRETGDLIQKDSRSPSERASCTRKIICQRPGSQCTAVTPVGPAPAPELEHWQQPVGNLNLRVRAPVNDMYGIGLKISNDSPHGIMEATNLRDTQCIITHGQSRSLNHLVVLSLQVSHESRGHSQVCTISENHGLWSRLDQGRLTGQRSVSRWWVAALPVGRGPRT